jgi:two-component system CheB/CheR fusion protein
VPVAAIGASAGGLEAISELLQHLPVDTGMAFVLVQHLDPERVSNLAEILRRVTKMPVETIAEGTRLEANRVYVIPSTRDIAVLRGVIHLMDRPRRGSEHLPIDQFFRSLAADQRYLAIGVVLSGAGSDGALGLRAIRAEGGITFAQDLATARYGDMPSHAVATGAVDFILPPKGIAEELARIASHPRAVRAKLLVPDQEAPEVSQELNKIFLILRQGTGVDFSQYKPTTVRRRIGRRMVVHKIDTLSQYVKLLQHDRREVAALLEDMLINVTSFFRDPDVFETLKEKAFSTILEKHSPDGPVRIWVPACSTGEEAYSMAIALAECLDHGQENRTIQIFATDVSETAVEKARIGLYPESIASDVSRERLRRFFSRSDGGFQISKTIRDTCVFARQDVTRDPPFSRLDLISCRNLLIYMASTLQNRIIPAFHYALNPWGFLLLGSSETVGRFSDLFALADRKHKLYRKKTAVAHMSVDFGRATHSARPRISETPPPSRSGNFPAADLGREADNILLSQYAPGGVIVNDDLEIIQFRGQTGRYLQPSPGHASLNLMKMACESLRLELRTLIHRARSEQRVARKEGVRIRHNGDVLTISVDVVPVGHGEARERHYLVLFCERPGLRATESIGEAAPRDVAEGNAELRSLAEDLETTKESLRVILEERDATTEELRAANEEIQSSNEELQSINEELETAKEELQSTNEELTTVNEELENRNADLSRAINDYNNLLNSIEIPIVMLDGDLRIRMFTPSAQAALNLIPGDRGRPIRDLNLGLSIEGIEWRIEQVIQTLQVAEEEVQGRNGRRYIMQIRPYRTSDNHIEGAVLSLIDVTDKKTANH